MTGIYFSYPRPHPEVRAKRDSKEGSGDRSAFWNPPSRLTPFAPQDEVANGIGHRLNRTDRYAFASNDAKAIRARLRGQDDGGVPRAAPIWVRSFEKSTGFGW